MFFTPYDHLPPENFPVVVVDVVVVLLMIMLLIIDKVSRLIFNKQMLF